MSEPRVPTFRERLAGVIAETAASRRLGERAYEELLLDPDFDQAEFERFRAEARRRGIALPEDDPETLPAELRSEAGEPERDLMDLYLREIGRVPLLAHGELLEAARRARRGDERARKAIILANLRLVVFLARRYPTADCRCSIWSRRGTSA
jgi:RNA polymerase primary sigma factor